MTAWYDYGITQGFKWTDHHRNWHSGVDLGAPWNTPVTAPFSGTVIFAQCKSWGGQVDILTTLGGLPYVATVLHLHSFLVTQNQQVTAGQLIGYSGGDGRGPCPTQMPKYSNGPHIHFEMTLGSIGPYHGGPPYRISANSTTVDPIPYLNLLRSGGSEAIAASPSLAESINPAVGASSGFLGIFDTLFALPQATASAVNAFPGIDNLIYRLHEAETFPGWKSLAQTSPLDALIQPAGAGGGVGGSVNTAVGTAEGAAAGAGVILGGLGGAVLGSAASSAVQVSNAAGALGSTLSPGRIAYWLIGNVLGNARAAFVRLVYLGIGGMLFLALMIALGSAQAEMTLNIAEDVTKAAAPALEAAAVA